MTNLGAALRLTALVWLVLLAGQLLSQRVDPDVVHVVAFGLATVLVGKDFVRSRHRRAPTGRGAVLPLAAAGGYALHPVLLAASHRLGLILGVDTPPPVVAPMTATALAAFGALVLAPLFEELLYRGQLFEAVRASAGPLTAIFSTAALFALPHLTVWGTLGAFVAGVALGMLRAAGASLTACVGIHAGANLGVFLCGIP